MPSRYYKDDLEGIPSPIREHLEACKRGLSAYPFRVNEALDKAKRASKLAMDIERRVRFYKAECYRRLDMWEQANGLYERCIVVTKDDEKWLLRMRILCESKVSKLRKDKAEALRLRRDNIEVPRPHRQDIENSRPRKDSRLRHKEGRGNVKEYRGENKRVRWR